MQQNCPSAEPHRFNFVNQNKKFTEDVASNASHSINGLIVLHSINRHSSNFMEIQRAAS